ncbi:MAG: SurA N-terminal domain-containing protein [Deltaproteobacteria bacterium]|nr:SurA N-terminal domain-containing protein [Deltaproteobacteria bacterium]
MFMTMMRRHSKSILIKIIIGLIGVVFVFWGIYSIRGARPGSKIAYVNGDLISGMEYQATYRDMLLALQRQYKDYWNEDLIKVFQLKQKALDSLIEKRLISQEASRLGLKVNDEEIADAIYRYPAFQVNGEFDENRYRSLLNYNRMEPSDFETGLGYELLGQKIGHFIKSFLPITDNEIIDYYTFQNEKVNLGFVAFNPEDFKGEIKVTQTDKEDYFKAHEEKYRIPPQIKISYLTIDPSDFEDEVSVTEGEIADYYEYNPERFKEQRQVKARHILFKVPPDASKEAEAEIKDKALEILKRAQHGEEFAELAKKYSQDASNASNGGDLGYFKKGQMVEPFEELAFSLDKGEVGGPVRTQFGWHLIKVEDIKEEKVKTLDEVREQIETTLKEDISRDMARERALTLMDQMPYDIALSSYAAQHGLTVKESGLFPKKGNIPGFGTDEKLKQAIYSLNKGEISEILEHEGKYYIFQVIDTKDSYIPTMSEVADQLSKDVEDHLSLEAAKKQAEKYLEELRGGAGWQELSKRKNTSTQETGFFSRGGNIPTIGYAPAVSEAAFLLSDETRYPDQPFTAHNKVYVIRWLGREGIDRDELEKEKKDFAQVLEASKERRVSSKWLQSLRDRAKIKMATPMSDI